MRTYSAKENFNIRAKNREFIYYHKEPIIYTLLPQMLVANSLETALSNELHQR